MSEVRALIMELIERGIDPVDAAEIVARAAIIGAQNAPKQRSAGAIRQERYRRNKASQVTEGDACDATGKENTPTPPKENPPLKENPPKGGQKKNPRQVLACVLSEDDADAVAEHRQRLKKPLTVRAAELLAGRLAAAPQTCGLSAQDAANLMIEKGWQSFEPEWARNARPVSPPHKPPDWQTRMNYARRERAWATAEWGPPPGQPGCKVPISLIQPGDGHDWNELRRDAA